MLKSGIPPPAVRQKMMLEGVTPEDQAKVLGDSIQQQPNRSLPIIPPTQPSQPQPTQQTPPPLPPHLRKYQIMMKSGVPQGAVNHKMIQENIPPHERNLVFGLPSSGTNEGISSTPLLATASAAPPAATQTPAPPMGPKFIGLHWDPIHVNDHLVISKSIWGEINTTHGSDSLQLAQEEYSTLSTLFAKKDLNLNDIDGEVSAEMMCEKKKIILKRKSSMPTTIDMSRSTNISIGLSSFKQKKMTIEMIINSLNHFDVTSLGQEDLLRLQEILPTDNEVKSLQNTVAPEGDLHETELWLKKLTTIDGVSNKVKAMTFIVTAESTICSVGENLNLVRDITDKILACSSLRDVLKCVLAIGNSMNHGTWKGGARAIKLASLTKLSQTKSVDGKSTVMDYLIQMLNSRGQNGDVGSVNALNIDEELKMLHVGKNVNMTEISKEVEKLRSQLIHLSKEVSLNTQLHLNEIQRLQEFITLMDQKITELEQFLSQVMSQTTEIITLFGEEMETPINQIMGLLSEFLISFTKSKENLEKKLTMERRKALSQIRRKSLNSFQS